MGFMDKVKNALSGNKDKAEDGSKDKAADTVDQHSDQIDSGIDKGSAYADDKTGGKHSDQIERGGDKAREGLDRLDGEQDDFSNQENTKNDTGQNTQ